MRTPVFDHVLAAAVFVGQAATAAKVVVRTGAALVTAIVAAAILALVVALLLLLVIAIVAVVVAAMTAATRMCDIFIPFGSDTPKLASALSRMVNSYS